MSEYLVAYTMIGITLGIYLYLFHYERQSKFAEDLYKTLQGEKPWHYRVRERLVIPGAISLITICWPLAIYIVIWNFIKKKMRDKAKKTQYLFLCKIEHLEGEYSVDAIEAQNIYVDPQNAVPKIPFGHLNKAWSDFIENKLHGDKLHKFTIPKNCLHSEYSHMFDEDIKGYALVRNGKIIAEFVTESYQ